MVNCSITHRPIAHRPIAHRPIAHRPIAYRLIKRFRYDYLKGDGGQKCTV
jgi:hypothetical protein